MSSPRLNEDQARAVWRRAAELQAAAEQALPHGRALQPGEPTELSIDQVTAAAEGAGIQPEFVRLAVAEQGLPDAAELGHYDWRGRWLQRVIREPHVIQLERVIDAEPAAVLAALRTLAPSQPYGLAPESSVGADPLEDAVLVYRAGPAGRFGSALNFADVRVLLVTVRPHEHGTLLSVRAPLFRRGLNLLGTGVFTGVLGWGGGAVFAGFAGALGAGAIGLAAVTGVATGGALGLVAYRALYRTARRGGEGAIRMFLQAVAMEAETGAGGSGRLRP